MKKTPAPEAAPVELAGEELGYAGLPLCREPWESYYILRRGILPCCYGYVIAPMPDWEKAWNSPQIQEIRHYLSRGQLSPYCLESLGCPIVQRVLGQQRGAGASLARRPAALRLINRLLFRIPGKVYRWWEIRFHRPE